MFYEVFLSKKGDKNYLEDRDVSAIPDRDSKMPIIFGVFMGIPSTKISQITLTIAWEAINPIVRLTAPTFARV